MIVGCLGDIVFQVSNGIVETLNNFVWSGSANYQTHQRHLTNALTEFVGLNPDTISFDVVLSAYLGVNPMDEVTKMWQYERNGTALPLILGDHAYGKYRWSLVNHKLKASTFDRDGTIMSATVSISLQEYLIQ